MEGFTVALALVDAIPVLFFGGSMLVIAQLFHSPLFLLGAAISFVGGLCQVLWKLILGASKKDVRILHKVFVPMLSVGWIVMLVAAVIGRKSISLPGIWAAVTGMPSVIFFVLGILAIGGMVYLAKTMDQKSAKANWIEQSVNAVAQGCFFVGLLLILL